MPSQYKQALRVYTFYVRFRNMTSAGKVRYRKLTVLCLPKNSVYPEEPWDWDCILTYMNGLKFMVFM